MRPIDADDLINRIREEKVRGRRTIIELIYESKTITDFSKVEKKQKEG